MSQSGVSEIDVPQFRSCFVMTDEFSMSLKEKAFVCWKMLKSMFMKLEKAKNENEFVLILETARNDLSKLMVIGWERVHCGKWDKIDSIWRDLYALSCYGNAVIIEECFIMKRN